MIKSKKNVKKESTYLCVVSCTYNMLLPNGEIFNQLYRAEHETDNENENSLAVLQGTIVPKHFIPKDEQAQLDRDDQMENPQDYIRTHSDLVMIAGLMVKRDYFNNIDEAKIGITKSISDMGVDVTSFGSIDPEDSKRNAAVKHLIEGAGDIKNKRKRLNAILKAGGVTGYFTGGAIDKLAAMVYDHGLYEG